MSAWIGSLRRAVYTSVLAWAGHYLLSISLAWVQSLSPRRSVYNEERLSKLALLRVKITSSHIYNVTLQGLHFIRKILNRNKVVFLPDQESASRKKSWLCFDRRKFGEWAKKRNFFSRVNSFHASQEVSKKLYSGSQTVQSWRTHSLISKTSIFSYSKMP